jgi:drug/metabolite transporter (DMT)-like permease
MSRSEHTTKGAALIAVASVFFCMAGCLVKSGSLLLMLEPVLCYVVGLAIFGEPLTLSCVFGSVLVIGACAVVLARRRLDRQVQTGVSGV